MSTHKTTELTNQPNPARRALLTGGAVGLAAVAGAALAGAQPASAGTPDVTWITATGNPTTDTGAVQAALNSNGSALLAPGKFAINATLTVPAWQSWTQPAGSLIGSGPGATVLMYSGTGPAVSSHGTASGTLEIEGNGARIMNLTIDGTNVTGTAVASGLDVGDQADLLVWGVTIQNFTSTGTTVENGTNPNGAVGLNINNQAGWTEKYKVWVMTNNCTNHVQLITTTGDSTSHMYAGDLEIHVNAQPNQNGLVIAHDGHLMNGRLIMRGNFLVNDTSTGGAAIVLGTQGQQGHIQRMYLDVHLETDGSGTLPQTIAYGTNADNTVTACHGRLQFLDGWTATNGAVSTPGVFVFFGPIVGDSTLSGVGTTSGFGQPANAAGCAIIPSFIDLGTNSSGPIDISPNVADMWHVILGHSNAALTLNSDGGLGAPQRKTIVIQQQGSPGGYTVTWPHNSSPSLSSPTVLWPGGTAPVMTSTANAIDVYKLETLDGITWYGEALQKVG